MLTPDQQRRAIRKELHIARCADNDHTEERLWRDARELDNRMTALGLIHPHTWWGTKPKSERGEIPAGIARFLRGKSTQTQSPDPMPQPAPNYGEST